MQDILEKRQYPLATRDKKGNLRVAAAVGPFDFSRAELLDGNSVDALVVDCAHGHNMKVVQAVKDIKGSMKAEIIAGNIATSAGAEALVGAGVDGIKVGIGPGSICTTRMVAGVGVPQITAIANVAEALHDSDVTLIADGGIRYSGDVVKAIAAGAHCIMIGSLLAGTDESPGQIEIFQGRSYKSYRGMGSLGAMGEGSSDRYFQEGASAEKLVPEGVEGRVPYKGPMTNIIHQLMGGLRSGMGYTGSADLDALRTRGEFVRITGAGIRESHVHDVVVTKEAPNYQRD